MPEAGAERSSRDFDALYQAHHQRIYQYCLSRLGNAADAEDATQESFFRATRQLHRLVGEPAAYLTAIAHNVCYDLRRSSRHQALPLEDVSRADDGPGPELCAVQRSLLNRAWIRLNRQERSLLAHTYAGFSHQEIAHATGLSAKAVSVGICRARKRVRQAATAACVLGPAMVGRAVIRAARRVQGSPAAAWSTSAAIQPTAMIAATVVASMTAVVMIAPTGTHGISPHGTAAAASLPLSSDGGDNAVAAATAAAGAAAGRPVQAAADPAPSGSAPAVAAPVGSVPSLPATQGQPQNTYFDSMTASPDYTNDHTVFAAGWLTIGCASGQCPALFVSHDSGHSWTAAGKVGFQHGTVLLPPDYPTDPTVFVASDTAGLLRSADGGQTFTVAVPVAGVAAISPTSPAGHAQVLVVPSTGGQTLLYREGTPGVAPGPTLPAQLVPTSAIYAPDGQTILVGGGLMTNPADASTPVVESCGQVSCSQVLSFAGDDPRVSLASAAAGHMIVASTPEHVALSLDSGQTYVNTLRAAGQVTAVGVEATSGGPVLLVATLVGSGSSQTAALSRSSDNGRTLGTVATNLSQVMGIRSLLGLSGGRLLAGVMSSQLGNPFGVRCSSDAGTSWSSTC